MALFCWGASNTFIKYSYSLPAASEANLAWLRDVKARLAEVDGTEALIEGFGDSSGRQQRSV